jgi:hypothetical protein
MKNLFCLTIETNDLLIGSVSDPDWGPDSIRSMDPDPNPESGSGSRRAKITRNNRKSKKFHV